MTKLDSKTSSSSPELVRETFFPTHIYYADIPGGDQINQEILPHIYQWREEDERGIVRSNVEGIGSWHSSTDMHEKDIYKLLVANILKAAEKIFEDKGYDPTYKAVIDNMWANIHPRYGFNRSHTHPNSLWSGCYYVQTPPGSGRVYFSEPRAQALSYTAVFEKGLERNPSEWSEVYYDATAARMILFPAWLRHEVEPNLSELEGPAGDRISIAFNISQRKKDM